ncbi:MAG: type II toxin-antitoxin system death-on-curing family toxin [Bacteroidota bacterium]|nr:type II toxin-antitoxin system death-on-curing family toxin [Bacteroidota bacterium]
MMAIKFISEEVVLLIHSILLERYGGRPGIRDKNLLDSALAQPRITIGGKYLQKTIFHKAAAYGFHICKNHAFVDGNKRVAFVLMDIFLQKNGWEIIADETSAYEMMINLASSKMNKAQLAKWLEANCKRLKI